MTRARKWLFHNIIHLILDARIFFWYLRGWRVSCTFPFAAVRRSRLKSHKWNNFICMNIDALYLRSLYFIFFIYICAVVSHSIRFLPSSFEFTLLQRRITWWPLKVTNGTSSSQSELQDWFFASPACTLKIYCLTKHLAFIFLVHFRAFAAAITWSLNPTSVKQQAQEKKFLFSRNFLFISLNPFSYFEPWN